jgi:hypothetical protein
MKHKRLLLILGCLAALLLAGYATLRLTAPQHQITADNIEAIKKGMTEDEVEAILGVPAGDYSSGQFGGHFFENEKNPDSDVVTGLELVKKRGGKIWAGNETSVWIHFDDSGRVTEKWCHFHAIPTSESFLDKLRRWLGM